jgi:RHS repeat-associated protein
MATGVLSGTTSTYLYDAFGQRLKVTVGAGTPSVMEYGPANEILTETNSHVETDYAWLDGFPIAAIQPVAATVSAIHTDHLGTPQKATNASKTIVFNVNYDPNGKASIVTNTITQNNRFPGQYADVTGFNHNGFRDFNPTAASGGGRMLEVDPIGLGAGTNPYIYGGQNAYKNTDRLGLCLEDACIGEAIIAVEIGEALSAEASLILEGSAAEGFAAGETGAAAAEGEAGLPIAAPPPPAVEPPAATPGEQCTVSVAARTAELQSAIPAAQQGRITMAVGLAEDENGVNQVLIGTSEPMGYLRPGVTLQPGEILAPGTGHAEADIVNYAQQNGLNLLQVGATRPICPACRLIIEQAGASPATPLKAP